MFYDTFAGGCNISLAARELGLDTSSSDLYTQHFDWVKPMAHSEVEFKIGAIGWFSPPCTDFSLANPYRTSTDRVLFSNPTMDKLQTFFIENVPGFVVTVPELAAWAVNHRMSFYYRVVNLSHYGALQSRTRFIAVLTRSASVGHRFRTFLDSPSAFSLSKLQDFWDSIENVLDTEARDRDIPDGCYRIHTGSAAKTHRPMGQPFPTFTRSSLSRPYALKTNMGGLRTEHILGLEGFPIERSGEPVTSRRSLATSVVGDGVPYRFVSALLEAVI